MAGEIGRGPIAALGLCVACPITSRVRGYPLEVAVPNDGVVRGVVLGPPWFGP
jgi:mRNA-degrading endonuclease toxin of MazEF toxin-antitoxin module